MNYSTFHLQTLTLRSCKRWSVHLAAGIYLPIISLLQKDYYKDGDVQRIVTGVSGKRDACAIYVWVAAPDSAQSNWWSNRPRFTAVSNTMAKWLGYSVSSSFVL